MDVSGPRMGNVGYPRLGSFLGVYHVHGRGRAGKRQSQPV